MGITVHDQKNQPGRGNQPSQAKEQAKDQKLTTGPNSEKIVSQARDRAAEKKQDTQVRTLAATKESTLASRNAPTAQRTNRIGRLAKSPNRDGERQDQTKRDNQRKAQEHQKQERIDSVAFKYLGNQNQRLQNAQSQVQSGKAITQTGVPEELSGPGEAAAEGQISAGDSPLAAMGEGMLQEGVASAPQEGPISAVSQDVVQSERISPDIHEQVVSLENLIGPEATLTFREKMTELWGILEEDSTGPLDVLAHAPLDLEGHNAIELLMVESPQGVHFVAFLRNQNDFEMLSTFNRQALLPDNPTRQLMEAAMIAFQQIQTIAGDAARKLAEELKALAESEGDIAEKLGGVRAACLRAKRSKEGCLKAIDQIVEALDRLDKKEKAEENEEPETEQEDKDVLEEYIA